MDCSITRMKHGSEPRQRAVSGDFAEVTRGFEHAGSGPAQDHASALPAFDAPRDLAHPAEQILDQIGRGQHALKGVSRRDLG